MTLKQGPTWPITGEIDIIEGVNNYTHNQATVHTNVGCTIASSNSSVLSITGTVIGGTNCAADETGNEGCGIRAGTDNSFGAAFNANGGGVYASTSSVTLPATINGKSTSAMGLDRRFRVFLHTRQYTR